MIEVERRLRFTPHDEAILVKEGTFVSEKTVDDAYLDTSDFYLTGRDYWLRLRNGRYELKAPMPRSGPRSQANYRELETDAEIAKEIGLPGRDPLANELEQAGYKPVIEYVTQRKAYRIGDFNISIDHVDFGYDLYEIELMVPDEAGMQEAEKRIFDFIKELGLEARPAEGKAVAYLREKDPRHYDLLVKNGVVWDIVSMRECE